MTNAPVAARDWPAGGLEEVGTCPACGGKQRRVMFASLRDGAFRTAPGSWTLMRCWACGCAYLDPRPTPDTIALAYKSYYTHAAPAAASTVGAVREWVANDYRRARWGYRDGRAIPGGRLIPRVAPTRGALADREVRQLPALAGGRLLDVGCGSGAFLAHMAALGWRAEGIDPDPAAVARARQTGIHVAKGTLADLDENEHAGAFDAVTLSHVIEHLHDPVGDMARIHRLVRPGGLVWIATPNLEALGLRRFGRDWVGLDPPRHLVLFTRASLEDLLCRTGFDLEPPPLPPPHAVQIFNQSAAIAEGRLPDEGPIHGRRRLRALAALANFLAVREGRYAEELVVIARRVAD